MRKNWILYRIIVGILIFCMIFETGSTQALASGLEFELTDNDSDNDTDNITPDSGNNSDSDRDNSNPDSDNNVSDSDPTPDNNNVDLDEDENKTDADNADAIDNPDATASDAETDENTPDEANSEDEADETGIEAGMDEIVGIASDNELLSDIAAAEEAFSDIVSNKNVMALIYMTDTYKVRRLPDKESGIAAELESGHTVYLLGTVITQDEVWYKVSFWVNGEELEGYAELGYLAYSDENWLRWDEEYLYRLADEGKISWEAVGGISTYDASYADIAQFPAGYQNALTLLKESHPNWTFVPMNTKLDFNTAVSSEMGVKSLIQNTTSNASKGWVGEACPTTAGWYYATKDAVSYHMDPRNFLTETYVFQFEQLTFNSSYHTVSAIQTFLNSTFMKGTLPDDGQNRTYAQAFYEIGSARKLSPIHLASRVYLEQGQGNSGLISGTYPGYEGYYNFFNVQANGGTTTEVIVNGLKYAKNMGWNTRYKSLEGGASTIGNGYILKGQDTIYLEKFNVNSSSPHGLYEHQYMQNIQAPASESSSTKKMYSNAGSLNSAFVFKIPVFNNMPGLKLDKTEAEMNKGESLTLTASVNGAAINSNDVVWKSSDTSIVTVVSGTVTAVESGTAVVTASYDGNDASCTIIVANKLIGITLDKEAVTLRRPDTIVEDTSHLSEEEKDSNISSIGLKVSFEPEDTTDDKTITWTSSNKKVATVQDGIVTAVGIGETTITAKASKAGNKTAQCKVTVIAPVYKIEFSSENNTDTIFAGQSINLSAEYFPKDTTSDTTISWSSSDTSVATVAKNMGTVRGISAGVADITATIGGYSASHRITVEGCSVTFMDKDNTTVLKTVSTSYGKTIPKEAFPNMDSSDGSVFVGWYTGVDGTGSRFDHDTPIYQKDTTVYPCFEQQGKGFYVVPIGDQTYTGSAIKPEILVYDETSYYDAASHEDDSLYGDSASSNTVRKPLVLNRDYTVSYKNNKKAALTTDAKPPTITVKGKGNYEGSETITFNIVTKALTDTDITAENITAAYNGKVIKNNPVIYHNSRKLVQNTDYKLSYPQTGTGAYRNAGTYPVIVTGAGGYHGTLTVYETITPKVLLSKASIAKIPNQAYDPSKIDKENGIGIEPALTVTYRSQPLQESKDGGISGDYVVTYRNNFNIGTATATITAVDSDDNIYSGSKSINFKITATSISKATISGVENKTYAGLDTDVMQDNISVSLSGNTLTRSTDGGKTGDYVLEYKNINKAGTATVIVKGINKYTGTKKQNYKISGCDLSQIQADISLSYRNEGNTIPVGNPDNTGSAITTDNPDNTGSAITTDNPDNTGSAITIKNLDSIVTPYVKGGSKPIVLLSYKGKELTPGKDYTIKYKNNNAITTADISENKLPTLTISGKGLFKGEISGKFRITDGAMSDDNAKITMTAKDVVYTGKKDSYKTSVILTDANGKKLQAGKDYDKAFRYTYVDETTLTNIQGESIIRKAGDEVNEDDIPNVGTAIRVTVQGMGAYARNGEAAASKSAIYHIVSADIAKAKVTVTAKSYNGGRPVTLEKDDITVTLDGKELVLDTDYKIDPDTYIKNTAKGKASVTIYGIGANYGGTKKVGFTIKGKILSWLK